MDTMKALVIYEDGRAALERVPMPAFGEYEALVKITASALCGTDMKILHNSLKGFADYPTILGHEGVGEVVAVGSKVRHLKVGDCVALPFAKDFGWGAELKLEMIFQQLFGFGHGQGYPKERVIPEQRNKKILDEVKKVTHRKLIDILYDIDQTFLKETISGEHFAEYFYPFCKDDEVANYLKNL